MKARLQRLPSPALPIAIVALVLSSAGGATALTMISGKQIRDGSITGADVKNHSLTARDFRGSISAGSQTVNPGAPGEGGRDGANGTAGASGAAGSNGKDAFGTLDYNVATFTAPVDDTSTGHVDCPAGLHALGGGAESPESARVLPGDFAILDSYPAARGGTAPGNEGWAVVVSNSGDGDVAVHVRVVCAPAGTVR